MEDFLTSFTDQTTQVLTDGRLIENDLAIHAENNSVDEPLIVWANDGAWGSAGRALRNSEMIGNWRAGQKERVDEN